MSTNVALITAAGQIMFDQSQPSAILPSTSGHWAKTGAYGTSSNRSATASA